MVRFYEFTQDFSEIDPDIDVEALRERISAELSYYIRVREIMKNSIDRLTLQLERLNKNFEFYLEKTLGSSGKKFPTSEEFWPVINEAYQKVWVDPRET